MKNVLKAVVVIAFLAAGLFVVSSRDIPVAAATSNPEAVESRSLYRQHCASCHGVDGKSQTANGLELGADDLTTAKVKGYSRSRVVRVITNGKSDMPGFKKKLSSAQIASIANYIKSL